MRESDLDAVMRIQAQCYPPSMQEPRGVVLSRIAVAGDTSFVACADGQVCAYLFAYPSRLGAATALDGEFAIACDADAIYLHDLAVPPSAAGRGLARRLVDRALGLARERGLMHAALVSVQDSQAFWRRLGFRARQSRAPELEAALATYPGEAAYMACCLHD